MNNSVFARTLDNKLTNFSIENTSKTEYRTVLVRGAIGDDYLQFRSTSRRLNFPDFWNMHEVIVWRYIPKSNTFPLGAISEKTCPTVVHEFKDAYLIHGDSGREPHDHRDIVPFTEKYPDINEYFKYFNSLRDKYLERK